MGTPRIINWRSPEGMDRKAALLLPPGYQQGERLPVIVRVRPGEHPYARINRFGFGLDDMENAQILAAQGYAAYYPGFSADGCDPMKQFAAAVIPAINALIDLGIADPERLGF
jgi:dipeptidyl aminopeptidase/acylaminoacyl peptidase